MMLIEVCMLMMEVKTIRSLEDHMMEGGLQERFPQRSPTSGASTNQEQPEIEARADSGVTWSH